MLACWFFIQKVLRRLKRGEAYFAMLHEDSGNGVYDNPAIDPPAYRNGKIVQEKFAIE